MTKLINKSKLTTFTSKLWDKVKARDISSFLYSIDKTNNTKTLKAKREDGTLGDININIDDLASQSLDNTFDGENIFKDIYIKDTILRYVDNKNATLFMSGENQYSGVKELVVPANTYVASIVIGVKEDLEIGSPVTGINVGTIGTDNVVLEHLVTRGVGKVEENTYSVLSSSKVVIVPINRSFNRDVYFMVGAKGMLWNRGTGYNVMGGDNMPSPGNRVSPNTSNYFGKVAIIGKGSSLKERLSDMARTNEFNNFTSSNNFKKIFFEDGYLNTAILSTINNTRATEPSTGTNIYSATPSFRVSANTFVDKIIIGLGDGIGVGTEVIGVNIGVVGVDNNTVIEHLMVQGTSTAIENTYSEISCSKIISVPINRIFDREVYFMVGAKGMVWNEARYANVTASGGNDGMPSIGTRLYPNNTNYVGKTLVIGQGLSIQEGFEKAITTYNTVNQATSVGGNDKAGKLVKLSSNGKLDESLIPAIALNEVIPATNKDNALSLIGTGVGQINRGDIVTLNDGSIHIYKGRPSGETGNNFDRDFLSLSVGNGTVKKVNNVAPGADGNVTIVAANIEYHTGSNINMKEAIDGKVNTSDTSNTGGNGQGNKVVKLDNNGKLNDNMLPTTIAKRINNLVVSNNEITIYSDNININSSTHKTIKTVLDEKVNTSEVGNDANKIPRLNNGKLVDSILPDGLINKNSINNFTNKNDFSFYSPTVTRDFTIATFNEVGSANRRYEVFNNNHYVVTVHNKFTETSKRVDSLIVPIANAQVGDTINATYFVINNSNVVIKAPEFRKPYTVEDIDMVGCKCIRIQVNQQFNQVVGFGFIVEPRTVRGNVRIGLAYATDNSYSNSVWSSSQTPHVNQSVAENKLPHKVFPYKVTHRTTSELVTRFELEKVTQMYPRTLIGEMKQLSYDAGNSLDDGTNTWLRANGQAINSNDYPELYEKFNTSRTDDDIEVSIPSLSNEVGYYYICAK